MDNDEFFEEDENGNIVNAKGESWMECQKCYGEGAYDTSEADAECRGEGGWWIKLEDKK